jgi:hypothetical protein
MSTSTTVDLPAPTTEQRGELAAKPAAIFAATRRAVAVRTGLGLLLAAGSLAVPWLGLTLSPSPSAWRLTFSLAAVPLVHHVSYGWVVASLTLCATVSFVRSKGRATVVTRGVGWAFFALSVIFVVTTRLVGAATMFILQSDANQSQVINNQFLTNNNIPPPSQFLGINFDNKTLLLLFGLRLGWYLLPAAGVLLAGRIGRPATRGQRAAAYLSALAMVTVAVGLWQGAAAQSDLSDGVQAVATGRPVLAQHYIAAALRLNPDTAYDPSLEQALGQAEANRGLQTGLAEYAEAVRPVGKDLTLQQEARLYGKAIAALPAETPAGAVVRSDMAVFLSNATITSGNPNLLTLVTRDLGAPTVTFTVGRYYYEAGADSLAVTMLERARHTTGNSEVRSLSLTYIALAWLRMGDEARFRSNIVAAVRADTLNENVYAREISAGLYVPGTP